MKVMWMTELILALISVAGMIAIAYLSSKLDKCRKDKRECKLELEICEEDLWK